MKRESMKLKFAVISHINSSPLSFLSLTSPVKEFFPYLHINYTQIMHVIMCINYNHFNCSIFFRKTDTLLSMHALFHVSKVFLCSGISYKQLEVVLSSEKMVKCEQT